ncbi:uncharacterized protein BJ171DRAFT_582424 [Polychytrium aggregatum]|uniref:uncharacterized protein n=1 Tax=Polychytrium aggregatum TaxID=110093 RepID=UPI0022FEBFCB|nr:uncharacterized protein BJ171DRAFT_587337 [Polychytrium aggregatum]XP_052966127.1 uncharacterized protein BJ171DRAFT_582424 [Polychytrium aggregatum]KAI9193445.1 hypothetical protein BJ171DRAFT_587337 [Polychytrium aggregatum]KAI9204047.1 hypothetical protein BJ171DRAFT_582424 [Polychytrium aggregatum]
MSFCDNTTIAQLNQSCIASTAAAVAALREAGTQYNTDETARVSYCVYAAFALGNLLLILVMFDKLVTGHDRRILTILYGAIGFFTVFCVSKAASFAPSLYASPYYGLQILGVIQAAAFSSAKILATFFIYLPLKQRTIASKAADGVFKALILLQGLYSMVIDIYWVLVETPVLSFLDPTYAWAGYFVIHAGLDVGLLLWQTTLVLGREQQRNTITPARALKSRARLAYYAGVLMLFGIADCMAATYAMRPSKGIGILRDILYLVKPFLALPAVLDSHAASRGEHPKSFKGSSDHQRSVVATGQA